LRDDHLSNKNDRDRLWKRMWHWNVPDVDAIDGPAILI
jgi:hypothetical protein